jgi:diacylglycerol kinase family enzyme
MVALTHNALSHIGAVRAPRSVPEQGRKVAVVLNANARRVDGETLSWVSAVVPSRDLIVSRSLDELPDIAARLTADRYDAVLWGGGDGTFSSGLAAMVAATEQARRPLPEMGVLRLGTGNALAETIGAASATRDGLARDLHRARAAASRRQLSLIDVEGRPALFCGFGLDAQILDDFGRTVEGLRKAGLADALRSANTRYFLAVASRSIPRFVLSQRTEVVAVNRGAPAIRVDADGRQVGKPIGTDRVIWRGKVTLASCATIPFYGLGLRMFPHAQRDPRRFQLRLSDASAAWTLAHLPRIWDGGYQGAHIHDFLVDRVELVLSRPAPFQAGGDLIGDRTAVVVGRREKTITVV